MAEVSLGLANRHITFDQKNDASYPEVKKLVKFRRHLKKAEDIAFLPEDKVIVADKDNQKVRVYDAGGKFSKSIARGIRPVGIATTPSGMVAVVDSKRKNSKFVKVYSSDNGDEFSRWGDEFQWKPKGITFSNKGHIIVTDISKKAHSVGVYTQDGRQLLSFGTFGSMHKNFNNPCYVTVDMFDRIIVSDRDNHAVKLFDDRGTFLGKIGGTYGTDPGQLAFPRGVCTDNRGNIFVCDTGNRRVSVFSLDGRHIQDLLTSHDGIGYPFGIAYTRYSNRLAVTQHYSGREGSSLRKVRVYELDRLDPLQLVRG